MQRERATSLVEDLLRRLTAGGWPLSVVDEVLLFGSYARGALEPRDVDVSIEFTLDEQYEEQALAAVLYGKDPMVPLRRALVGRSRGVELQFELRRRANDIEMLSLWRRGDTLEQALARLHAITPDPVAGRAARDSMLPAFEGLDHWIPRPLREQLVGLVDAGAIKIEQLEVADGGQLQDAYARKRVRRRWQEGSPLRRAAIAALAHLEARGVSPHLVHLHGQDVYYQADTPYFVGLACRYVDRMPNCFADHGGVEWIEVPHLTRTQPLLALRITLLDREALAAQPPWG
jgi:predicted nucleotidyltransferase